MTKKRKVEKEKKDFSSSVFDPLGMYGAKPNLRALEKEVPTQDADDL